mgnify:CR=1 FL=1
MFTSRKLSGDSGAEPFRSLGCAPLFPAMLKENLRRHYADGPKNRLPPVSAQQPRQPFQEPSVPVRHEACTKVWLVNKALIKK